MFQYCNHLGFNNPYFFSDKGIFTINNCLSELLTDYDGERYIDPVSIIELLNRGYMFADRTMIQGIQRTPWLAKPNENMTSWEFYEAPRHDLLNVKENIIAKELFQKICSEIQLYIGNKKEIGILLSGGMDSRIVAGALDSLIKTGKLKDINVTCLTWGNEGTRDVVYAKEIAARLNWNWKHYKVTAEDLLRNIRETAIHGCEYSPVHLHAIPQIRDDNNLDIILAGSYGDSIGRAEYSKKKVKNVRPLLKRITNVAGLVFPAIYNHSMCYIEEDVEKYHLQFPEKEKYMQNELDYQLHYMRRMLNPCMELLSEKMEFFQVFTHPDVYGYMWSIDPERRNDLVYKNMLNEFSTKLDDIPWSRTGLPFGQETGIPDSFLKEHHSYIKILQNEMFDDMARLVLSDEIKKLGAFDPQNLKYFVRLLKNSSSNSLLYLEKMLWLASLAEMVKMYKINGVDRSKYSENPSHKSRVLISAEFLLNLSKIKIASYIKN